MSTPPSGFVTPRTTWTSMDPIAAVDLNRIEGNTNATEVGSRILEQTLPTPTNTGTLRQILSWFAGRIRAITGATNWFDAPATTLVAAHAHHHSWDNPHWVTSGQIGALSAAEVTTGDARGIRYIHASTATPPAGVGVDGDIWLRYT